MIKGGILMRLSRNYRCATSCKAQRKKKLRDSKVTVGHLALHKTLDRTRQRFWWPMMRKDVDQWVKSCKLCAAQSTVSRNLTAELQSVSHIEGTIRESRCRYLGTSNA